MSGGNPLTLGAYPKCEGVTANWTNGGTAAQLLELHSVKFMKNDHQHMFAIRAISKLFLKLSLIILE